MTDDAAGGESPNHARVEDVLDELCALAGGREDLVARLEAAAARAARPATIIAVVGEFKQGKSSLVNGMVGCLVCPVDDDLATSAITLVRHSAEPRAVVRMREKGTLSTVAAPLSELQNYVTEIGNPDNRLGVERVEVGVPSALLVDGLCIVDTPGVGSLGAGHAAATLAFIPFADGLVFVSDATSELTAPELDFLRRAHELCPSVMVVQPKIDMSPEWRRIIDINRGHLDRAGVRASIWPVSTTLRTRGLQAGRDELDQRSGFPAMLEALRVDVIGPAKASAAGRAATEGLGVIEQLRVSCDRQRAVIIDPARSTALIAEAEEAARRIELLRGPGARWATVLGDHMSDLQSDVHYRLRSVVREIHRNAEERIEHLKTAEEWDTMARDLQTSAADCVLTLFRAVEERRLATRDELSRLLGVERLTDVGTTGSPVDVGRFWREGVESRSTAGTVTTTGVAGLRGVQTGVMLLGTLTQFLPTAAAALLVTNPVLLGVGAAFGGLQLRDDRSRKLAARRQAARTQVRQFLDDLSFEVSNDLSQAVRDIQRQLRDEFSERMSELHRTFAETARGARDGAMTDEGERARRLGVLDNQLEQLSAAERRLVAFVPTGAIGD